MTNAYLFAMIKGRLQMMKAMKKTKSRILSIMLCFVIALGIADTAVLTPRVAQAEELSMTGSSSSIKVKYKVRVQGSGNQREVSNGKTAGTIGKSKRLEAIWIRLTGTNYSGGVEYRTSVQSRGWMKWVKNGKKSGATAKRIEAIRIKLYGEVAEHYDIYYRAYVEGYGWLDWAKNGATAGTAGQSKRLEAIQIMLVDKEDNYGFVTSCSYIEMGKNASNTKGLVNYMTHVQGYGDQKYVCDGSISGTSGESKRLEAIRIKLGDTGYSGGIKYRTHIQGIGWQSWKKDGQMSGTSGKSKRLEAIQIKLYGQVAKYYDVYYRVHSQTFGWLSWASNGEKSGTSGYSKRLEAIQIILVPKGYYSSLMSLDNMYGTAYISDDNLATMNYYARIKLCTGKDDRPYMTQAECEARLTTITVNTWDFASSSSMEKVTRTRRLTVNSALASYYTKIFKEIYNSPDKPVIDSGFYAYTYRANTNNKSVLSSHSYGVAIDINPSYNPNGAAAKSYAEWSAMPENTIAEKQAKAKTLYDGCTIVKILRDKYGLYWGGDYGGTPDSMHFEFFS
jgi:uncharacterized protein YjdB